MGFCPPPLLLDYGISGAPFFFVFPRRSWRWAFSSPGGYKDPATPLFFFRGLFQKCRNILFLERLRSYPSLYLSQRYLPFSFFLCKLGTLEISLEQGDELRFFFFPRKKFTEPAFSSSQRSSVPSPDAGHEDMRLGRSVRRASPFFLLCQIHPGLVGNGIVFSLVLLTFSFPPFEHSEGYLSFPLREISPVLKTIPFSPKRDSFSPPPPSCIDATCDRPGALPEEERPLPSLTTVSERISPPPRFLAAA